MIKFPTLVRLDVEGYGLYPGQNGDAGLHVSFEPGLTLIMGANGLGKTTLVTLLYRMCTGPYEIAGLTGSAVLGTRNLTAVRLQRWEQRIFAARVVDEAASATATLTFDLGKDRLVVTRALHNLSLTALTINGDPVQASDDNFQQVTAELAGVPTFGDWILILRYLIFYFEERRALVWDPTAQRQILRLLMLPDEVAAAWADKERQVLELDSRVRNLQNALNREEVAERTTRAKLIGGKGIPEQIEAIERVLQVETAELTAASDSLPGMEAERQRSRLRALTIEQEYDAARRSLERLELSRIAEAFPSDDETAAYLVARLISTDVCQTCGQHVPKAAQKLRDAIAKSECVVCGSHTQPSGRRRNARLRAQLTERENAANNLASALETAQAVRSQAEDNYSQLISRYAELDSAVAQKRDAVAALVRRLPPDERVLREQSTEVSSLRGRLQRLRADLDQQRSEFERQVRQDMLQIAKRRVEVIDAFQQYAEGFLFESSQLRWAPNKARVGQTGPTVDFPAFEFEMAGSDFPSPVRRSGPDQVSESQREFVDLAFRMALIAVAGEGGTGSLVIDAPEASLDAVFSERAALVLVRFANPTTSNRLIITSNLVDGQLMPKLLEEAKIKSARSSRFVDLLEIAVPTTAIREYQEDYRRVRDGLFDSNRNNR